MPIEDMNPLLKLKELKDALGFDLEVVQKFFDARKDNLYIDIFIYFHFKEN